jgi:hypothetical protein
VIYSAYSNFSKNLVRSTASCSETLMPHRSQNVRNTFRLARRARSADCPGFDHHQRAPPLFYASTARPYGMFAITLTGISSPV